MIENSKRHDDISSSGVELYEGPFVPPLRDMEWYKEQELVDDSIEPGVPIMGRVVEITEFWVEVDPIRARQLRILVQKTLELFNVTSYEAGVVVSELVGNAQIHGAEPERVEVRIASLDAQPGVVSLTVLNDLPSEPIDRRQPLAVSPEEQLDGDLDFADLMQSGRGSTVVEIYTHSRCRQDRLDSEHVMASRAILLANTPGPEEGESLVIAA